MRPQAWNHSTEPGTPQELCRILFPLLCWRFSLYAELFLPLGCLVFRSVDPPPPPGVSLFLSHILPPHPIFSVWDFPSGRGLYLGCESFRSVLRSLGNGSPCLVGMVHLIANAHAAGLARRSTALSVLPTVGGSAIAGVHPLGDRYSNLRSFQCATCLQVWCMEASGPMDLSWGVCVLWFLSS